MNIRMGSIKSSSLIKQIGFAGGPGDTTTLRIKFSDGAIIDFDKVPYRVFRGLVLAKNISGYYLSHVHGKFEYQKI
jgi:KTSC domain